MNIFQIIETIKKEANRLPPLDCNGECNWVPCACSGKWRYSDGTNIVINQLEEFKMIAREELERNPSIGIPGYRKGKLVRALLKGTS